MHLQHHFGTGVCTVSVCRADRRVALLPEHLKSRLLSQLHAFLKVRRLLTGNFMERGNKRGKKGKLIKYINCDSFTKHH